MAADESAMTTPSDSRRLMKYSGLDPSQWMCKELGYSSTPAGMMVNEGVIVALHTHSECAGQPQEFMVIRTGIWSHRPTSTLEMPRVQPKNLAS